MARGQDGPLTGPFEVAVGLRNGTRFQRVAGQPVRGVAPAVLRYLGLTREVSAQTFWGDQMRVVLPEPVSSMIYRFGYYDENVCRFLMASLTAGDTFVDIGAHFGFFSKLALYIVGPAGQVVAFEPSPRTRRLLDFNLDHAAQASILDYAVLDEERDLEFRDYGDAHSSFNSAFAGRGLEQAGTPFNVRARRFDDIWSECGGPRLDVMKIDAESAELKVLIGSEGSLARYRPVVIAEFGDFDLPDVPSSRRVVDWLLARDYRAFEASPNGPVPHQPRDRYGYTNLMFVPDEKVGMIDEGQRR